MPASTPARIASLALTLATTALPATAAQPTTPPAPEPLAEPAAEPASTPFKWLEDFELGIPQLGLTFAGNYTFEWSSVWSGGVNNRASARHLLTLDAELDLETLLGLEGGTVFAQYLSAGPESGGSADAGDIQVYSNIETDRHLNVLYELWYEQRLFDDRFRIKLGKVDANSEFAAIGIAGDFANSSAGFSPTVAAFPSYPDPAMSINAFIALLDNDNARLELGYGFYDGAAGPDGIPTGSRGPSTFFSNSRSDDYFHIAELSLAWTPSAEHETPLGTGRFALGGWHHTGTFERFDAGTESGTTGLYLTAEQHLIKRHNTDNEAAGLHAFAQAGLADDDISEIAAHLALGLVTVGTFPTRDEDRAGIYATLAILSDDPNAGFDQDELSIDAYYRIQLHPRLYIQPEIQYIINPSGDSSIDNALVGGIRFGIEF